MLVSVGLEAQSAQLTAELGSHGATRGAEPGGQVAWRDHGQLGTQRMLLGTTGMLRSASLPLDL